MTNLAVLNILTEDTEVSTERGDVVIHMLSSGVGEGGGMGGYVCL